VDKRSKSYVYEVFKVIYLQQKYLKIVLINIELSKIA